jgi:protein-L-isoaspartate(D-aspartate) O-methyltransferase
MSVRAPGEISGIGMTSLRTRARMVERLREQGVRDRRVLEAMGTVPRHLFVDEALRHRAYEDTALPINYGQTISQPYVVARMIEVLVSGRNGPRELGKVLEIGTGCGYQAAVLASIAREVYSVERIRQLHERARRNLLGLKLSNLRMVHADGRAGLKEAAPFDSIIIAAATSEVPEALLQQLARGGRMVLPLRRDGTQLEQRLVQVERVGRGFEHSEFELVRFVPLESGKA